MLNGVILIKDKSLIFLYKFLLLLPLKNSSLAIPLSDIEHVETMNLNSFMPFGVCIFMKDGQEYMLGHVNQRKLKNFIEEARLIN